MKKLLRDIGIVGGGIVGLATALALRQRGAVSIVILEAEADLASHQTGHNSGVIHSGLYYQPGSLKARNCVQGREELYAFCEENGVPYERCGKLVVATTDEELARLGELERRGVANGLQGLRRLDAEGLREYEPEVRAAGGLWVPETGIVDFGKVAQAMAKRLREAGVEIRTRARVRRVVRHDDGFVLRYDGGEVHVRNLLGCAGLQADRLARACGLEPGMRIVPFRGEYLKLIPERRGLVRGLIYPVPDPRFPFLGVHFTRTIDGSVEVGPNALLALSRVGYTRWRISARDALEILTYGGFWRLVARYRRTAAGELYRSLNRGALTRALQRMVPAVRPGDLVPAGAGVRAQAVAPDGSLVDDFRILESERMLHVLNAPSPAATASLAIGRHLAAVAEGTFRLMF